MNEPFQLVTNCNFKGKDYIIQMCVLNSKKLELIITDKIMAEDWQCEYDASYIEALTHKTGNFKQFDVFVMMLKSGLLKTSDCISLDLLTLEDLEHIRCKKIVQSHSSSRTNQSVNLNKRYLIITYTVEFDRIHYPLPLDYCGPPDPTVLQGNIRRLESEVERLKQKNSLLTRSDVGDIKKFKEKIQSLLEENKLLTNEIKRLNKIISKRSKSVKNNPVLLNSLKKLEEQVIYEKTQNRQTIIRLKSENKLLNEQIEDLKKKEKILNLKLREATRYSPHRSRRRLLQNPLRPENYLDQKRSSVNQRLDAQFSCRPVSNWNNSSTTKIPDTKTMKTFPNRYLSSSSSDSEEKETHRTRSRERRAPIRQNICSKRSETGRKSSKERSEAGRKSSKERSRHSSENSKRNLQTQRSKVSAASQEVKPVQSTKCRIESRSRESSLSSRNSSKQSVPSRFSNRGSGDCLSSKKATPRNLPDGKEDIKFTMSDLEARIRSLQKLLSEGLQF